MTVQEQIELMEKVHAMILTFNKESGKTLEIHHEVEGMIGYLQREKEFGFYFGRDSRSNTQRMLFFGEPGYGRAYISMEDNGKTPKNEWLYEISFSTGPYFFGECCPEELFARFFTELKSYEPAYIDSMNNCLYFNASNAKVIHDALPLIVAKYRKQMEEEYKRLRKVELEKELKKLSED